jgi:hypothetical protein
VSLAQSARAPFEHCLSRGVQAAAEEALKGGKEAGQALTSDKQNVDIDVQQPGKLEVWEKKG